MLTLIFQITNISPIKTIGGNKKTGVKSSNVQRRNTFGVSDTKTGSVDGNRPQTKNISATANPDMRR